MSDATPLIYETGSLEHARFLISDPDDRFWTGTDWSNNKSDARLFATSNDAAEAVQQILRAQHGDQRVRRYVAPVVVDLYADREISFEEIAKWLSKVSRLIIDPEQHGNGPVEGSLGLTRIDWGELREITLEDE